MGTTQLLKAQVSISMLLVSFHNISYVVFLLQQEGKATSN